MGSLNGRPMRIVRQTQGSCFFMALILLHRALLRFRLRLYCNRFQKTFWRSSLRCCRTERPPCRSVRPCRTHGKAERHGGRSLSMKGVLRSRGFSPPRGIEQQPPPRQVLTAPDISFLSFLPGSSSSFFSSRLFLFFFLASLRPHRSRPCTGCGLVQVHLSIRAAPAEPPAAPRGASHNLVRCGRPTYKEVRCLTSSS